MERSAFPWDKKDYLRRLDVSVRALRRHFGAAPPLGIVFGSGLGEAFVEKVAVRRSLPYVRMPHFTPPTVLGHDGKILKVKGKAGTKGEALVLMGRSHYYEGYAPEQVVFALRALSLWGVSRFVITNASGSLVPRLKPGDLAWIRDHINLTGANPLRGPNLEIFGPRFPSLVKAYRNPFSESVLRLAKKAGIPLKPGVYVGIAGPSYETEAEIAAFRKWGGDMVGMSTVMEVIAAAHAGRELIALSAITNSSFHAMRPVTHEDVLRNAKRVDKKLARLLLDVLKSSVIPSQP